MTKAPNFQRFYRAEPFSYEERESPRDVAVRDGWNKMALQFIRAAVASHPQKRFMEFTTEEIGQRARDEGFPAPGHPRWWGPVVQKAQAEGIIRQATVHTLAGPEPLTRLTKSKHRSPVWEPVIA